MSAVEGSSILEGRGGAYKVGGMWATPLNSTGVGRWGSGGHVKAEP